MARTLPAVAAGYFASAEGVGAGSPDVDAHGGGAYRVRGETRSNEWASIVLREVGEHAVSRSTAARIAREVGTGPAALQHPALTEEEATPRQASSPALAPEVPVVECDGGRIRRHSPGQGRGVHGAAWRETKNARLLRMSHPVFSEDPHPELSAAFCDPAQMAALAELAAPPQASVLTTPGEPESLEEDWRPQRLVHVPEQHGSR